MAKFKTIIVNGYMLPKYCPLCGKELKEVNFGYDSHLTLECGTCGVFRLFIIIWPTQEG